MSPPVRSPCGGEIPMTGGCCIAGSDSAGSASDESMNSNSSLRLCCAALLTGGLDERLLIFIAGSTVQAQAVLMNIIMLPVVF